MPIRNDRPGRATPVARRLALGLLAGGALAGGAFGATAQEPPTAPRLPPAATFAPVFRPCAHCHEIGPGAKNQTGPQLDRVIGRPAGRLAGYPFSDAMRASGLVWDEATLAKFLKAPAGLVQGTRMIFPGIDDDARIAAIIAYLQSAGDAEPARP